MEKAKSKVSILCPDHGDCPFVRVSPDLNALKQVYCAECLLQTEDPKAAYANFPKISDFLASIASTIAEYKDKIQPVAEVPKEFLDVDASRAEALEKLSKRIDGEKKKIETFFENITNVIVETLCQLKNQHLELLDRQVINLHDNYVNYEKTIKRLYPKKEEIDIIFPTQESLEDQLSKVSTALDLDEFVKNLKQTAVAEGDASSELLEASKQNYLKQFKNILKNIESNKPTFEESLTLQAASDEIKKYLDQFLGLGKAFLLKNIIPIDLVKQSFSQSTIANLQQIQVLRDWLPEKNRESNLTLLYRMTRDGRSGDAFHSRCDKKGSTLTLIKCLYDGASQTSIIGGFSDKDFDRNGKGWVSSNQAFIFSLTPQIKCHILKSQFAIYNGQGHNIIFGGGGTIGIRSNFVDTSSYVGDTYANSLKIIPPECSLGLGILHKFQLEELEVFQLD